VSESEHALELLARLSPSDRHWIVERLSATAKSRLVAAPDPGVEVAQPAQSPAVPQFAAAKDVERLNGADPERIWGVLRSEPCWMVCAVLRANDWPWRRRVLQAMPPGTRAEISRLERRGTTLSRPAMDALLKHLAERVGAPQGGYVPPSRFESLLARLRELRHA